MLFNKLNFEVVKFCVNNESKPEISGVFFLPDKTVATDTFRLVEISTDAAVKVDDFPILPNKKTAMKSFKPFIISRKAVMEVAKMNPGNSKTLPILNYTAVSFVDDKTVEFINTDLETGDAKVCQKVDGKFPDYEMLFIKDAPVAEVEVNGNYMAEILTTLAKFNLLQSVKIKFYGKDKPVLFETSNENQKARAALMPLRNV